MKKVYIAHPLTGNTEQARAEGWGDPETNVERYLRFCAKASNEGHVVISWVHHYLMHARGLTPEDADFYLSRDRMLLAEADELWVCGPESVSEGLRQEVAWARGMGIPVVSRPEWMDSDYMPGEVADATEEGC